MRTTLWFHLLPLIIITVIALTLCWPLLSHPFTALVSDDDGRLLIYLMHWTASALSQHPDQLFSVPIYYPNPLTLTFSDPMITGGLIGWPFWLLTKEPVIFNTVNFLLAVWLSALGFYALVWQLAKSRSAALSAALLFSATSVFWEYRYHLQVLMVAGIPWSLYGWFRFSQTGEWRWLLLWLVSLLYQALNAPQTVFFLVAAHGLFLFDSRSRQAVRRHWQPIIITLSGALLVIGLLYLPYFRAAAIYQNARTIRDAAHFALSINELLFNRSGALRSVLIVSVLLVTIAFWKKWQFNSFVKGAMLVAVCSLLLTLGPVLKWQGATIKIALPKPSKQTIPIPLPYALTYYLVPGFKAFRTPDRWMQLAGMMMIVAVTVLWRKKPITLLVITTLILCLDHSWNYAVFQVAARTERPAVFDWLDQHQVERVLFLPLYVFHSPPAGSKPENERMVWSIRDHGQPLRLVNGTSGYTPADVSQLELLLKQDTLPAEAESYLSTAALQAIVLDKTASASSPAWLREKEVLYLDERFSVYQF